MSGKDGNMKGYLLLADGARFEGTLRGTAKTTTGWLVANTGVVGFQEMATDPAYKGQILAFTYPEIGNVGVAERFSESHEPQVAGMVVKVLSEFRSHYLSEDSFENMLSQAGVTCLAGVDTRGVAVHLREKGEMPAAIATEDANLEALTKTLGETDRPQFEPTDPPPPKPGSGAKVAVLNLGIRRSQLKQFAQCCNPIVFAHDARADSILGTKPAGLFVSDGPGASVPPQPTVQTLKALIGKVPILAIGLGNVALGVALGCEAEVMGRGHHGANYAVRNLLDGTAEVTQQRHSIALNRDSVLSNPKVQLLWENMTDQTVEGICTKDGSAVGLQAVLAGPAPGLVNGHISEFVDSLAIGRAYKR